MAKDAIHDAGGSMDKVKTYQEIIKNAMEHYASIFSFPPDQPSQIALTPVNVEL